MPNYRVRGVYEMRYCVNVDRTITADSAEKALDGVTADLTAGEAYDCEREWVDAGPELRYVEAPEECSECGSDEIVYRRVSVGGDDNVGAWVCDTCGQAHLADAPFSEPDLRTSEPTPSEKVMELHDALIAMTETFEGFCPTLPYLYAAILCGTYIDYEDTSEDMVGITREAADDPTSLLAMLRVLFPPTHWVWRHVRIYADN